MAIETRARSLLGVKEVAAYLQVNQTTIYRLLRKSQIPAFKVGGDWRFDINRIDAWFRFGPGSRDRDHRAGAVESAGQSTQASRPKRVASRPDGDAPQITVVLHRIAEDLQQMLGPIAEISRMLPTLQRIADALEDKRDPSSEISRLYQGKIAFRHNADELLKFVPSASGVVDRDRRLVSFNDAFTQLLKFPRKHLRSVPVTDLVHPDDLTRFITTSAKMWEGKTRSASIVVRRLTGKGDAVPVRSRVWAIRSAPGGPPQYLASVLEKVPTPNEATSQIVRSAEGLSRLREKLFARR